MLHYHAKFRMHTQKVTKETLTSKTEVNREMARLTLDEVLASDNSANFGHLDSESEEEEDEGVSLASSNSAWRSWQRLAKLFLLSL